VIYLDTSVALAHLLAEDRSPPDSIWEEELVSSRLLEYELWNRIHARDLERSHGDLVRLLLARLAWLELLPEVLGRATRPFPAPVRTLDALHLASVAFLRERGREPVLATYDERMAGVAIAMGIPLAALVGQMDGSSEAGPGTD
jgi:predicted nucleic acid-binding protein